MSICRTPVEQLIQEKDQKNKRKIRNKKQILLDKRFTPNLVKMLNYQNPGRIGQTKPYYGIEYEEEVDQIIGNLEFETISSGQTPT